MDSFGAGTVRISTNVKRRARHLMDRVMAPYVVAPAPAVADAQPEAEAAALDTSGLPSHSFHDTMHELRTLELERIPKGGRRVLSVGANGRWYFDWFERAFGEVDEHYGVEAFEQKPEDLQPYVKWIVNTADDLSGVTDSTIDVVFAGQTTEHLFAVELADFLAESHRVLDEGGYIVLDSPNRLITQNLHWSHGGHTVELSADEIAELLELAGFTLVSTRGVWNCVVDGRLLQLEEAFDNAALTARRSVTAAEHADDSFIWWVVARRSDTAPQIDALRKRAQALFAEHWPVRVSRGMLMNAADTSRVIDKGSSGCLAANLPFLMGSGDWQLSLDFVEGQWSSLDDFRVDIVTPGNTLVHRLDMAEAEADGTIRTWRFNQPGLLFTATVELHATAVHEAVALRLPIKLEMVETAGLQ